MKKDIAKIEQKPTPRDTQHQNIGHRKVPTTQITRKEPNPAQDPIHTTRTTETTTPATMTIRKDPTTQNTKKDPNPAQDKTHTTRTTDATTAATTTTRKQGTETEATTSQDNETGIATRNTHHPDTRATTDRTKTIGGEETQHPAQSGADAGTGSPRKKLTQQLRSWKKQRDTNRTKQTVAVEKRKGLLSDQPQKKNTTLMNHQPI